MICDPSQDITSVSVEVVTFVSIYRAPRTELLRLLAWKPSRPTVIGGDFNSVHPDWQPMATQLHGDGQLLVDWNIVGLVWSNIEALADISIDLDSTLDHRTLAGDVPRPNSKSRITIKIGQPFLVNDSALEDFTKLLKRLLNQFGTRPMTSTPDVDNLAEALFQTIGDAIRAAGRRRNTKKGRTVPW